MFLVRFNGWFLTGIIGRGKGQRWMVCSGLNMTSIMDGMIPWIIVKEKERKRKIKKKIKFLLK